MARPRRPSGSRLGSRLESIRRDIASSGTDMRTSMRTDPLGSTPPGSSPAGRLPGESQDDYIYRTVFGGDEAGTEQEPDRQRAGRAATAARYGEGGGNYVSEWQFPASSRVRAYQWDEALQQLRVRFIKYETPWVYNGVPLETFQAFDSSDSKGRYINDVLNSFSYRRANEDEVSRFFQGA